MKTRLNILRCMCFLALLLLQGPAFGSLIGVIPPRTDIRGRVIARNPHTGTEVAVPHTRIDLYLKNGDAWEHVKTTHTNAKGYYYLLELVPQTYVIQINREINYEIKVKPKVPDRQFQNIAPIKLS